MKVSNLAQVSLFGFLSALSVSLAAESPVRCTNGVTTRGARKHFRLSITVDGRVEAHTHEITATGTLDPAAVPGGLAFGGSARVLEHSQMRTYILTSDRGDVYFLEMNRCGHGDLYHGNTWVDAMGCGGPEVSDFVRRMGADCDGD